MNLIKEKSQRRPPLALCYEELMIISRTATATPNPVASWIPEAYAVVDQLRVCRKRMRAGLARLTEPRVGAFNFPSKWILN
jgi:hypothetical protein